jgi:hypothetical protein
MERAPSWVRPLVIAVAVVMVGLALAVGNGSLNSESLDQLLTTVYRVAGSLAYYFPPLLLVGAALYARTRQSKIIGICLAAFLVNAATVVIRLYWKRPSYFDLTPTDVVIETAQLFSDPSWVVPLLLLATVRFRPALERWRIAFMVFLCVAVLQSVFIDVYLVLQPRSRLVTTLWFAAMRTLISLGGLVTMGVCAWCMAFCQVTRHRPPGDAQKTVSLVCPRCRQPLEIPTGNGQCPACRLQIFISLEEGMCARCAYPLRGLTGDKCPKCGTPFANNPSTPVAAGPS